MRWKILWDKKKLSKWINEKKRKLRASRKFMQIIITTTKNQIQNTHTHIHGQPSSGVGVWQNPKKKEKKIHSTDGKNEIRLQFFFIWKHIVLVEKK